MRSALALGAGALVAAGCLPTPATAEGEAIDSLYRVAMAMAAVVAAIVWGLLVWVVIRYRRRRRASTDEALPPQTPGNTLLELIWTAGPLLAVGVLFVLTLLTLNTVAATREGQPVQLNVEAFRWGWRMTYPANGITVEGTAPLGPEAVLPVGRTVVVNLTADDVVHAFYVPQFLYKKDAIPGQTNVFNLTITEPGTYAGQCAEFCGVFHAQMPFTVRAVSDADFQAWLAGQPPVQASSSP